MYFVALATDYDGTLARDGRVDAPTIEALKQLKQSGRKLILVTGRDLPDLQRVFPEIDLFDVVVVENGALLFDPATKEETPLAEPPSSAFVERLRDLGVSPLTVGRTIVATWQPNETAVLSAIRDLGLDLHIIFNKGAVMVLPGNVNKAWGLRRALKILCLSPHNVVGIGDAENDLSFLGACGCAVAVENALPSVKAKADLVVSDHGAGVIELARRLTDTDLRTPDIRVPKAKPVLGTTADDSSVYLSPFETTLIAGSSGGGKSTVVTALLEQMRDLAFQFCVVDPEGDYQELLDAVVIGNSKQEPRLDEAMSLLAKPDVNVVVNLLAIDPAERPRWLATFLPDIAKLRAATGRPHWIVIDETHHCLPAKWDPAPVTLTQEMPAVIAVTVHPEEISLDFLKLVSTVVGVGNGSLDAIRKLCNATGRDVPAGSTAELGRDQVHVWTEGGVVEPITVAKPKEKQKRHARKYAEGELGEDKSFYFRGSNAALNLRAQNLSTFLQLAIGVDDDTWMHHLRAGEYSKWFREAIKDEDLASEASAAEKDPSLTAQQSRARLKEMVERRYTAPAKQS